MSRLHTVVSLRILLAVFSVGVLAGCLNNKDAGTVEKSSGSIQLRPNGKSLMAGKDLVFSTVGGKPPYQYSVIQGGGTISAATGLFTAGSAPGLVIVQVKDTEGSTTTAAVSVVGTLALSPEAVTIVETTTQTFAASGGLPPYSYSISIGDGSVTSSGGVYTAPAGSGSAVIVVTDALGNTASSVASVIPKIVVTPGSGGFPDSSKLQLQVVGGKPPYAFSLLSGGGTIDPITGLLETSRLVGSLVVRVKDSLDFTKEVSYNVFIASRVAVGSEHTCAITPAGVTKCWGSNWWGQIGKEFTVYGNHPSNMGDNLPTVSLANTAIDIATSGFQTCAILNANTAATSGTVKCWGLNSTGQLGLGHLVNRGDRPNQMGTELPTLTLPGNAVKVITGNGYSCALMADRTTLKCWGLNNSGELGSEGGAGAHPDPTQATTTANLGLGARTILDISTHANAPCALLSDGNVKCWGLNSQGQLGTNDKFSRGSAGTMGTTLLDIYLGHPDRRAKAIETGYFHACVILSLPVAEDGKVLCWGANWNGQIGIGLNPASPSDPNYQIGDQADEMGDRIAGTAGKLATVNLTDASGTALKAVKLALGRVHTCALLEVSAGYNRVKCWGNNGSKQLGRTGVSNVGYSLADMGTALPYVDLGTDGATPYHVEDISAGHYGTCAIVNAAGARKVKCWGGNTYGFLGAGMVGDPTMGNALPFVELGTGRTALKIVGPRSEWDPASHPSAACALLDDYSVKCWGRPLYGNLGQVDPWVGDWPTEMGASLPAVSLGAVNAKEIKARSETTCALLSDDTLKCWGKATLGELGNGNVSDHRGDRPSEMGAFPIVNFGTNGGVAHKVGQFALGINYGCAVLSNAATTNSGLKCWGSNWQGIAGQGGNSWVADPSLASNFVNLGNKSNGQPIRVVKVATGEYLTCALTDEKKVKCWGPNTDGSLGFESPASWAAQYPYVIDHVLLGTGRTAKDIAVGSRHACAVLDNDQIKCWGYNAFGQLGLEDAISRGANAGDMGDALPFVNLGTNESVVSVWAGGNNTCAILKNGRLKCWGDGTWGVNGLDNSLHVGRDRGQMGNSLLYVDLGPGRTVLSVSMGASHMCAVLDNNGIKCWGANTKGQLGLGDLNRRGTTYPSMGVLLPFVSF